MKVREISNEDVLGAANRYCSERQVNNPVNVCSGCFLYNFVCKGLKGEESPKWEKSPEWIRWRVLSDNQTLVSGLQEFVEL